ncbi:MAG: SDR family oxidoreductase [Actinomycetota bacterium]
MDLVTGATGHLGNTLVRKLAESGRQVRVFLRKTSDTSCLDGYNLQKSYGDIQDPGSVMEACKGIDTVYHTAAEISIMPFCGDLLNRVNCRGTDNVISACFKHKVKKLIFTSSIHALADTPPGITIDEKISFDPRNPRGAYDRTKAYASLQVLKAAEKGLDAVVLCPTAFIGPYDFKVSLLGQFLIDYMNGNLKFIIDGAYDYVDVRDVAAAHITASQKAEPGQTYILSGEQVDMRKMVKTLSRITGKKQPRYWLSSPLASLGSYFTTFYYWLSGAKPQFTCYSLATIKSNSLISHHKANRDLGYKPRPFEQSLNDTLKWYRELTNLSPAGP